MKTYYFPDAEHIDTFFGSYDYVCVDRRELERLARDWGMSFGELRGQVHEASEAEIAEYGVYDS